MELNHIKQVREKKQKLADSEADLVKRHRESKEKLEQQKRDLETRVAAFQQEKVTLKDHYLFINSGDMHAICRYRDTVIFLI